MIIWLVLLGEMPVEPFEWECSGTFIDEWWNGAFTLTEPLWKAG